MRRPAAANPSRRPPPLLTLAALGLLGCAACAVSTQTPTRGTLDSALRARTSLGIRVADAEPLPPQVVVADGLTSEEAVAIALWNSPSFQATLADLGIVRADVIEAGLLRNPVFSVLFPLGPKQLEWALQFPFEVLWQRPRRVAMAEANARVIGERLVWDGLTLVAQARSAHADAVIAERRVQLSAENADVAQRLARITEARLRAGDISELEARASRADAARAQAAQRALEHDQELARVALAALLGLDAAADQVRAVPDRGLDLTACGTESSRLEEALAARPDVRAAEIGIEAAGDRARWERSRVWTLVGVLDGNGTGANANAGPGVNLEIPVFNRNQGGIARADAEIERASRQYTAVRAQVLTDVRSSSARVRQAEQAAAAWRTEVVPSLEGELRQAERAYQAGEIPLYVLLEGNRRLLEGRSRLLDADADLQRAAIALERSIGRSCQPH
jgi:cobalt-zinc-cadmium efflux system outer membrane protein